MRDMALPVAREMGASFDEVDVDGEKAFSVRVSPVLLRQRLAREGR
jgi:hypothetical protein